jgi:hypothetical protein
MLKLTAGVMPSDDFSWKKSNRQSSLTPVNFNEYFPWIFFFFFYEENKDLYSTKW